MPLALMTLTIRVVDVLPDHRLRERVRSEPKPRFAPGAAVGH